MAPMLINLEEKKRADSREQLTMEPFNKIMMTTQVPGYDSSMHCSSSNNNKLSGFMARHSEAIAILMCVFWVVILISGYILISGPLLAHQRRFNYEQVDLEIPHWDAVDYLHEFGYFKDEPAAGGSNSMSEETFEKVVRSFQEKMGLEVTGKIDRLTSNAMEKARCGNKDFERAEHIDGRRTRRFALQGNRWQRNKLTYKVSNYPTNLLAKAAYVDRLFERAFRMWSKEAPLDFELATGKVDLEIKFVRDEHGECLMGSLDDTVKVLAHAFYPSDYDNGKTKGIHFNDYVKWKLESVSNNKSLLATALHEIGHALGLSHSNLVNSKMYAIELGRESLHTDDIDGIKSLYGDNSIMREFYTIEGRLLSDEDISLYDKNANSVEECAKYALDTRFNLTVWNKRENKCSVKKTTDIDPLLTFYTRTGKGVSRREVQGHDYSVSNSLSDVMNWASNRECDAIVRTISETPELDLTSYSCKRYTEDDCCTILFKIDETVRTQINSS